MNFSVATQVNENDSLLQLCIRCKTLKCYTLCVFVILIFKDLREVQGVRSNFVINVAYIYFVWTIVYATSITRGYKAKD